jgi:lipid-binding SYLF domain-containing protein
MDPLLLPDKKIPASLLGQAEGFLFLTFLRLGFLGGARLGSGLAVVKREDGTWSAPSAVGMAGLSVGLMAGGDCVNLCLVLMSRRLCTVLASKGSLNIEGELGASLGPIGRTATGGVNIGNGVAPVYSYCQSSGLFAGVDINGSVIMTRDSVNHRFYGLPYEAQELLMGDVARPDAGHPLYEALTSVTAPRELPSRFED